MEKTIQTEKDNEKNEKTKKTMTIQANTRNLEKGNKEKQNEKNGCDNRWLQSLHLIAKVSDRHTCILDQGYVGQRSSVTKGIWV